MGRSVASLLFFSLLAATALAEPPRSVNEIPVFRGAMRDLAAEQDFMQFASGVARAYRTRAPLDEVFDFYKGKLDARPEAGAEMTGGSAPAATSSSSVGYSVEMDDGGEEGVTPLLEVRRSMRAARFYWTVPVKDGTVSDFAVELSDESEDEPPAGAQPRGGTRIAMIQMAVMAQAQAPPSQEDDKKWLASLPPPKIRELDPWRDVTVIRGFWAFHGKTGGDGPLAKGTGSAGGNGHVTLKRAPLDRSFPGRLTFTGPIDGAVSMSEHISLVEGTTTESGRCDGSLIGQDQGFSYMSVTLDLDDGTYSVDLSGTVGGCSKVEMQVTGQDVSFEADTAGFSVMPDVTAAPPKIPLDGLYLKLSSPVHIVAGHGLPLVGKGGMTVQLGRVPDGWNDKLRRKAEDDAQKPPKEEPPKEDGDPNVIPVRALIDSEFDPVGWRCGAAGALGGEQAERKGRPAD